MHTDRRTTFLKLVVGFILLFIIICIFAIFSSKITQTQPNKINVVAAENFWGSIVSQIGGDKVNIVSIVTDPNADPHEYETSNNDARLMSSANYVITNGAGYDSWANKLLSAENKPDRKVLTVASLLNLTNKDNPHIWYNPTYVNKVSTTIKDNLITLDPTDKAYFDNHYAIFQNKLSTYQSRITAIKHKYAGVKVSETEDIFNYLSQAAGLDLISPESFAKSVSEGQDPPASSVATIEQQLNDRQVKLLVYNLQTVTPITNVIKQLAQNNNIPIVGVSETIQPLGSNFQDWMNSQLIAIQAALNESK